MLSFKLETTLKRLDELIVTVEEIESNNFDIRTKVSKRVADWFELVYIRVASVLIVTKLQMVPSRISEMVDLSNKDNLFGLTERIVAVESLAFLGSQFDYIQPYLMHLVPDEKKHLLQHFYLQVEF